MDIHGKSDSCYQACEKVREYYRDAVSNWLDYNYCQFHRSVDDWESIVAKVEWHIDGWQYIVYNVDEPQNE